MFGFVNVREYKKFWSFDGICCKYDVMVYIDGIVFFLVEKIDFGCF